MLTRQQKLDIIKYITGCSTKALLEDVDSVGQEWTEENGDQLRDEIDDFILLCRKKLKKWVNNEHGEHLDGQGQEGRDSVHP